MKVLVTGVAGQLGHDVMNELTKVVPATYLKRLEDRLTPN